MLALLRQDDGPRPCRGLGWDGKGAGPGLPEPFSSSCCWLSSPAVKRALGQVVRYAEALSVQSPLLFSLTDGVGEAWGPPGLTPARWPQASSLPPPIRQPLGPAPVRPPALRSGQAPRLSGPQSLPCTTRVYIG